MASDKDQPGVHYEGRFVRRLLLVFILGALILLLARLSGVLLLGFGAVVVAVVLRALVDPLRRRTPLNESLALSATVIALVALIALGLWLFGREIAQQVEVLAETLPAALSDLLGRMEANALGRRIVQEFSNGEGANLLSRIPGMAFSAVSAVTSLVVVVVTGVILASRPALYRDGLVMLFPQSGRGPIRDALNHSGRALKLWLLGQFIAMATIGVLTGIGLYLAGVPSPLALGLFAGLAQFVPLVGPIVSAIPGLLLATSEGMNTFLWALAVYVGVQQFESNFLTPWVERRAASLPMPITLFAVMAFGVLFGLPGVILATPLAVVLYVLVKELYVRDILGDQVPVPGERNPPSGG